MKKKRAACMVIAVLAANFVGCVSTHLGAEQDRFRSKLLKLNDDQIKDNLIRVYNHRPIIQLAYSAITGTVTNSADGGITGSHENSSGTLKDVFGYSLSAKLENKLTVTANPVLDGGGQVKAAKPGTFAKDLDREFQYLPVRSRYEKYLEFVFLGPPPLKKPPSKSTEETSPELSPEATSPELSPKVTKAPGAFDLEQYRVPPIQEDKRDAVESALDEGLPQKFPGKLFWSECEPKENVHWKSERRGMSGIEDGWYWVPAKFSHDYLALSLYVMYGLGREGAMTGEQDAILNELRLNRLGG